MTDIPSCPTVFMWFRKDLRLYDNQALTQACGRARALGGRVTAVYTVTPNQWQRHDMGLRQLDFIRRQLHTLAKDLAALGIELQLWHCPLFKEMGALWQQQLIRQQGVAIYAGQEAEIDERRRDESLLAQGLPLTLTHEHCLLPPGQVLTQNGDMYRVFTPFMRRWCQQAAAMVVRPLPAPAAVAAALPSAQLAGIHALIDRHFLPLTQKADSSYWPVGEDAAHQRLEAFTRHQLYDYPQQRDFPALAGCSGLSPYLTLGILSPRQCFAALLLHYPEVLYGVHSPGRSWLAELIWREFYRHLLVAFPRLGMGKNFNPLADGIIWRNNKEEFAAWCHGRTGYPIVDAAMRQLHHTGWMHNRLRMIVASFLSKHLLVDWRWGERYFRQQLLDGDLAANNGGWQWSAGTGCDAQPWFRIFNPMSQSEKFDGQGHFIRRWLPELQEWSLADLHRPAAGKRSTAGYPPPLVEHGFARQRALAALAVLKKG
ncbi:deoxyribodipyrimidine photo-lyase [Shewanella sp. YIC-542]|uniref:deoxyribodipyrimidine photo-lyase n=1 Tax=Shewanella mytili TaxID=3377111 RepID=UPI00398F1512